MTDERLDAAQVRAALRDEALTRWSWFETGPARADEAGIREDGDGWLVYSTDERAVEVHRQHHGDESAALEDFLRRAQANTRYFRRRAERLRAAADGLGCEHCRAAVHRGELPMVGRSLIGHVIVRRCPSCATFWLETERLAHPVTREEAAREAPDVPLDA